MLLNPFLDANKLNDKINDLIFNFKAISEQHEKTKSRNFSINLKIDNPKRLSENELKKVSLDINANISSDKLIFNNCSLLTLPAKWDDNTLKLTGEINLKKSDGDEDEDQDEENANMLDGFEEEIPEYNIDESLDTYLKNQSLFVEEGHHTPSGTKGW